MRRRGQGQGYEQAPNIRPIINLLEFDSFYELSLGRLLFLTYIENKIFNHLTYISTGGGIIRLPVLPRHDVYYTVRRWRYPTATPRREISVPAPHFRLFHLSAIPFSFHYHHSTSTSTLSHKPQLSQWHPTK
jgi:hypothetical protein